jgi:paraquat-inducible protein B
MTQRHEPARAPNELPQARLKRRRWGLPVVWLVPLAAALVAGYLVYDRVRDIGPLITIAFKDASGVKAGQTDLEYRGVQMGEVKSVELARDRQSALVQVRLRRPAATIARDGSEFWIVRIQGGIENLANLGTVITGAYLAVKPGSGKPLKSFVGLDHAPVGAQGQGLKIVVRTRRLGSLRPDSPVYYRGVQVGAMAAGRLSADATAVDIPVFIDQPYAKLVRKDSRFWNVSGVDLHFGLFRGLNVRMQSLRSLATGGIAFATPDEPKDEPAKDGTVFRLHEKPAKAWLAWSPKISIARGH